MKTLASIALSLVLTACGGSGGPALPDNSTVSANSMEYVVPADGRYTIGAVFVLDDAAGHGVSVGMAGRGMSTAYVRSEEPSHTECVTARRGEVLHLVASISGYSGKSTGEVFVRAGC